MAVLRTPDEQFLNLPGYDFDPHYIEIADADAGPIRVHYIDEGPADGEVVLMMHGEPSWCYLYRKMVPLIAEAGYRAIAVDLVGFGARTSCLSDLTIRTRNMLSGCNSGSMVWGRLTSR